MEVNSGGRDFSAIMAHLTDGHGRVRIPRRACGGLFGNLHSFYILGIEIGCMVFYIYSYK